MLFVVVLSLVLLFDNVVADADCFMGIWETILMVLLILMVNQLMYKNNFIFIMLALTVCLKVCAENEAAEELVYGSGATTIIIVPGENTQAHTSASHLVS